ncbi:uncharacterized protein LOC103704702 [Phoenix dactylifera]|uniref:Uncharacterized protein LOC103704702 n=1 Tax=Phoenix dactylifera TaxID=42345 RepID=A0A8B7BVM1_PHODC|nr:uncharacterized protein LOC103704702 [Phoenix dactylifera]
MGELALWEEERWICWKHPSRPCYGVCPACLRDRLLLLCPDCANVRPCGCSPLSSSSSASSFSSLYSAVLLRSSSGDAGIGAVGRVSNLIESEPAFRRSGLPGFQLLRSRSVAAGDGGPGVVSRPRERRGRGWGAFWSFSRRKVDVGEEARKPPVVKLSRSRSVGVVAYPDSDGGGGRAKGWVWLFPSPMKAFRHRKSTKDVQQRSPLSRG